MSFAILKMVYDHNKVNTRERLKLVAALNNFYLTQAHYEAEEQDDDDDDYLTLRYEIVRELNKRAIVGFDNKVIHFAVVEGEAQRQRQREREAYAQREAEYEAQRERERQEREAAWDELERREALELAHAE